MTAQLVPVERPTLVPTEKQRLALSYDVDELLFGGSAGGGKDLHVATPILTTHGWKRHGDLRPGDYVYDERGRPVRVLASYVPAWSPRWVVTFSNGEKIVCGNGHLWNVMGESDRARLARADPDWKARRRAARKSRAIADPKNAGVQRSVTELNKSRAAAKRAGEETPDPWDYTRTLETGELREMVKAERQSVTVPLGDALQTRGHWSADLNPWVFGLWLGDGGRQSGNVTIGDGDRVWTLTKMKEAGFNVHRADGCTYSFRNDKGESIQVLLSQLYGQGGQHEKRIPEWVFNAPYESRLSVIRGLFDADGSVNERGQVEFCVVDKHLFNDTVALLATLGLTPSATSSPASITLPDGTRKDCGTRYRLKFSTDVPVFAMPRKAGRLRSAFSAQPLRVVSIERADDGLETNCITVDSERHLYRAGRTQVVTHNSYAMIAAGLRMARLVPGSTTLLVRRTHQELHELRRRIQEFAPEARFNKTDSIFYFPNGSEFRLGHARYDDDVMKWQGAELQLLLVDELTQFTRFQYTFMRSRLRAAGRVLERMNELGMRPHSMCTANPGGIGHAWVKGHFITPAPAFQKFRTQKGQVRVYVPARLTDNPHLDQDAYMATLRDLDPVMRRAMIEGDWDILLGSVRFPQWRRSLHVVEPEEYPIDLTGVPRVVGVDYGVADPFAATWCALMPDGTVVVYRELLKTDLTAEDQVKAILEAEAEGERVPGRPVPVAADRSMWNRTGRSGARLVDGTDAPDKGSIAWPYWQAFKSQLHRSNSDRLAGWAKIDEMLRPRPCDGSCGVEDCPGHARLVVYSTCVNLLRDLPSLPRARHNPEDAATHNVNDHGPDSLRYALMDLLAHPAARSASQEHRGRRTPRARTAGLRTQGF